MTKLVREKVSCKKIVEADTDWKNTQMGPRNAPVYPKSKPARPGWEWRSLRLAGQGGENFVCLFEASPKFGKWKAWLMEEKPGGEWAVVVRLEDQPGQAGLHAHTDCADGTATGTQSINLPQRWPEHGRKHRRIVAWTKASFFNAAIAIFRIDGARLAQEELPL